MDNPGYDRWFFSPLDEIDRIESENAWRKQRFAEMIARDLHESPEFLSEELSVWYQKDDHAKALVDLMCAEGDKQKVAAVDAFQRLMTPIIEFHAELRAEVDFKELNTDQRYLTRLDANLIDEE